MWRSFDVALRQATGMNQWVRWRISDARSLKRLNKINKQLRQDVNTKYGFINTDYNCVTYYWKCLEISWVFTLLFLWRIKKNDFFMVSDAKTSKVCEMCARTGNVFMFIHVKAPILCNYCSRPPMFVIHVIYLQSLQLVWKDKKRFHVSQSQDL